jgi:hypothetical protein
VGRADLAAGRDRESVDETVGREPRTWRRSGSAAGLVSVIWNLPAHFWYPGAVDRHKICPVCASIPRLVPYEAVTPDV